MQNSNNIKISALFNLDVLVSLAILVGMIVDFSNKISSHLDYLDPSLGISRFAYFMAAIAFLAILILLINGAMNKTGLFIWLAVFYVMFAFLTTVISGRYPVQRLPFRFIELFYWVAVMSLAYFSVLALNTPKIHVAIVALAIPFLAYRFYVVRQYGTLYGGGLLLNPVYFISFLMPVVLLLKSKLFKTALLLLVFIVIVLSYKRMAIIAYAMSAVVYFYCLSLMDSDNKMLKNLTLILGAMVLVGILVFAFRYLAGAFNLDWAGRMSGIVESGGGGRLYRWREMLSAMASEPGFLILGRGWGAMSSSPLGYGHNDILEILHDFGLIGLVLYLLFVGKLFKTFFEMKRLRYRHFGAFGVSLVWWFWGAMTDVFVNYPYWFLGLALFWGISIADFEMAQEQAYLLEMDESWSIDQYGQEGNNTNLFYEQADSIN